jgi:hypothetical protein
MTCDALSSPAGFGLLSFKKPPRWGHRKNIEVTARTSQWCFSANILAQKFAERRTLI